MTQQREAWAGGDAADAYFLRNQGALTADAPLSPATRALLPFLDPASRLLEIGSSNGYVLEQIRRAVGCRGTGVDPSPLAIADGQAKHPHLDLRVAVASDLSSFESGAFTAVLCGFCLYLVDRAELFRVVAEVDRVLAADGVLAVTDFDPIRPSRRPFHHQPGLWSYKADYPALWLANPQYTLAAKTCFAHDRDGFHPDPQERIGSWILKKQSEDVAYEGAR